MCFFIFFSSWVPTMLYLDNLFVVHMSDTLYVWYWIILSRALSKIVNIGEDSGTAVLHQDFLLVWISYSETMVCLCVGFLVFITLGVLCASWIGLVAVINSEKFSVIISPTVMSIPFLFSSPGFTVPGFGYSLPSFSFFFLFTFQVWKFLLMHLQ